MLNIIFIIAVGYLVGRVLRVILRATGVMPKRIPAK